MATVSDIQSQLVARGVSIDEATRISGMLSSSQLANLPQTEVDNLVDSIETDLRSGGDGSRGVSFLAGKATGSAQSQSTPSVPGRLDPNNPLGTLNKTWTDQGATLEPNSVLEGSGEAQRKAEEADAMITKQAWALLTGDITDPDQIAQMDPKVLERSKQIQQFLNTMNGNTGTSNQSTMSVIDQLKAALGLGSGGGGGGGSSSIAQQEKLPVTPDEQDSYVREHYGFMAGYLSDPELGPILHQAAAEGWTSQRLQGALMNTNYWKTSSASIRTWDAQANTDPASAREKVAQLTQTLKAQAQRLGLNISGSVDLGQYGGVQDRLAIFAARALREGWSQEMITDGLFHEAAFDPTKDPGAGQIAATRDAIKKVAGQYMLDVSDPTATQWAADILDNKQTLEGVTSLFKQQAKGRYASLAPQIDQGFTPEQFFDSYKQGIAKELEIDPTMVNMMDPKWSQIVDYSDPKTGSTRPMTLSEAQAYVRSQPEWQSTKGAQTLAANVGDLIGKTFGKLG